ncbi:Crp/Fnr family transcriptional regulator [Histidinibacterium aquaticum]|uniref:Crp/Fnr family transcriptional regulator n=1 Tax=Histidinibacterium aquaticum TaxID=2613962 RepID=A0A5J5GKG5_9RHOB|nr:Crp/Fnr family transcriptional regulator [Histidinibacterium aquaticum]KAA9008769.1 Crp/Fnr family transcriptional regulator [Histidinibacterium aquaticum]
MLSNKTFIPERKSHCLDFVSRHFGLCAELDPNAARSLAAVTRPLSFTAGEAIFSQGDPADRIGIVTEGIVKIVDLTQDGSEHVLSLLSAGDIVGEIGTSENQLSWEAATDVSICGLERPTFERLLSEHRSLLEAFSAATRRQLQKERLWASSMRSRKTQQRVAVWLYTQLPQESGKTEIRLALKISRRDLASLLDMSAETLCRVFHTITDFGAIQMPSPDMVVVKDRRKLLQVARGRCPSVSAVA